MSVIDPQLGFFEQYFLHKKINKIFASTPKSSRYILDGLRVSRMAEDLYILGAIRTIYAGDDFLLHRHSYDLAFSYYYGLLYTNTVSCAATTMVMRRYGHDMEAMTDSELMSTMQQHRVEIAEKTKVLLEKEGFIDRATSKAIFEILRTYFERARRKVHSNRQPVNSAPIALDASNAMLYAAQQDVLALLANDPSHVLGQDLLSGIAHYWRKSVGV